MSYMFRVGVDVGGTFTDLIAIDEDGNLVCVKVPTTPRAPELGVVEAFKRLLSIEGFEASGASMVFHATTVATNALFGQFGLELPKTALITTKGFRDVVEIGRQRRPEPYNIFFKRPKPLVPRRLRYEVDEKVGPRGEVIKPINPDEVRALAERIRAEGVEAVAIGLINSYMNPKHELEIKRLIVEASPKIFISASSEVSPEYREYERISTTVVNAVLMPIVQRYVENLIEALRKIGVNAPLYIMQSSGGLVPARDITSKPASMVESGPASGVVASTFYGSLLGERFIMSFDMGGTTAKAGAVIDGRPETVMEYEVGGSIHKGRVVKGSGYPVRFPFIDLAECGAGGGTIAWVDEGGSLRIGPVSAGAEPGPACYGMGGVNPTITDANLILGRLPNTILGGRMRLNPKLAEKAITEKVAEKLGLSLHEAAYTIIEVANSIMAKILRVVSVERGHDPRGFTMIAFGGAGPLHACALADDLGISKILIPVNPGLFSALGLLISDVRHDLVKAFMEEISLLEPEKVESAFKALEAKGLEILRGEGFTEENISLIRCVEARYVGQSYEIMIPVEAPFTDEADELVRRFHERHEALYGFMAEDEPVELVNIRVTALGLIERPKLKKLKPGGPKPPARSLKGLRDVYLEGPESPIECPVYIRERLKPGNTIDGPLIVEQYDSTTLVNPGWSLTVDPYGNLVIYRG